MSEHPAKRGAKPGNKNAAKPKGEAASSFLHIRCRPDQMAGWYESAQRDGKTLTEWVIGRLES